VPKIIEVPRERFIDKVVEVNTRIQRVNYRETAQTVPINTILKKNTISHVQKRRFQESSIQLANTVVENEKMKAELTSFSEIARQRASFGNTGVNVQERDRLQRAIYELESSLRTKETERNRLRQTTSTAADMEIFEQQDASDIPKLQSHIQRVRAENENLRRIAAKGGWRSEKRQVGSRVSHQTSHREAPVQSAVRRSTSATITQQRVTGGNINILGGQPGVRQSGTYTTNNVTRTSAGYSQPGVVSSYNQGGYVQGGQTTAARSSNTYRTSGGYTQVQPATTYTQAQPTSAYAQGHNTTYTQGQPATYTQGQPTSAYTQGGVVRRSQTNTTQTTTATPGYNQVYNYN
jgi:hypothetical protein